ncbi:MAG: hypothetical protein ACXACY_30405 [Candidatus Hodarchaeales archaeon]|jgi:hypothetical protein
MLELPSSFVQDFIDFFTIFLVTIPEYFINEGLSSGIFYDIWQEFFGTPEVLQLGLILALVLGVWVMLTKQRTGKASLGAKL